jgi:Collagen triple helix repeat (20 copies)
MRLTPWQGIGLLVAALVLAGLAIGHAAAAPTCSDADKAFDGRRYTEAAKLYIEVLAEDPGSACVKPNLVISVRTLCSHANWLKRRRHPEDAAAAYAAIFKLEPTRGQAACRMGDPPADTPKAVRGPRGPRGYRGKQGSAGENGNNGKRGPQGDQGPQGERGRQGKPGDEGQAGENGNNGRPGPRGAQGPQGERGRQGPRGEQGRSGKNGKNGRNGRRGPQGRPGPQGPAGARGGLLCCTG